MQESTLVMGENETDAQTLVARPEPRLQEPRFIEYVEVYYCPRCQQQIAADAVHGKLTPGFHTQIGRTVYAWCDHCSVLFKANFIFAAGQYQKVDGPAVVSNVRELERFAAKLAALRGDRQLTAAD